MSRLDRHAGFQVQDGIQLSGCAAASVCGQLFDVFGYIQYLNCKRTRAAKVTNYSLQKSIAAIYDAPVKWILPLELGFTSDSVE
jgi:hypothetical protein